MYPPEAAELRFKPAFILSKVEVRGFGYAVPKCFGKSPTVITLWRSGNKLSTPLVPLILKESLFFLSSF